MNIRRLTAFVLRWSILAVVFLALAGCGGDDNGPDQNQSTQTPSSDAGATQAAKRAVADATPLPMVVGEVVWATAIDEETRAPERAVTTVDSTTRTIYAVVPVSNIQPGQVFTAKWSYNETALDGLTTSVSVAPDQAVDWVEFHLTRSEERWPDGDYAVTISAGDEIVQRAEIAVMNVENQ